MKNATLVLMTIAIACCLIVSREASAGGRYSLTGPVEFADDGILNSFTMVPSSGSARTSVEGLGEVESFFDVFTELAPQFEDGQQYHIDSFFDVFTELSVDGGRSFPAESFFDVFVEVDITRNSTTGTFATEIVSMSLSGNAPQAGVPDIRAGSGYTQPPSCGEASVTDLGGGLYHIDSFFDVFTELSVDGGESWVAGGTLGGPTPGTVRMRTYPDGVPAPREVSGKEYSHHHDINAPAANDPMQNLAWDGTGNAWDTFDYSGALNGPANDPNVDAIANIKDKYFQEVVRDEVALLVTLDEGVGDKYANPDDYQNIYYQTVGPASVGAIWADGVIPGAPPTSQIHTAAVQVFQHNDGPWLNPTGIEVWGPEVKPGIAGAGGATGDNAIMFSTTDEWDATGAPRPAVWKYDPTGHTVTPYLWANQIRDAIDSPILHLVDRDIRVNLDGMMIFDVEKDDVFGPGDSIMFTVHTAKDLLGNIVLDGGEIWVWKFDDGPLWSAQFLVHGEVGGVPIVWDTLNVVSSIFPSVVMEENIGGLEAVPEPATMTLLALGGLAVLRRRRRR